MIRKPPYTPCKLYYDGNAAVEVGHFLRTPAGSAYAIQNVRRDRKREYRVHLNCLRWPEAEIPAGATVHPLHWYKRQRRRAISLSAINKRQGESV